MPRKKLRPSPAFPMYPKDFLGDENTMVMSVQEFGAYSLLLLHAWEAGGRLANDPEHLAGLARMTRRQFDRAWSRVLSRCFTVSRNKRYISNPRQTREVAKQRAFSAQQSAKARARWDKDGAAAMPRHPSGSPAAMPPTTPSPSPAPASPNVRTSDCKECPEEGEDWGLLNAGTADQATCGCPRGKARAKEHAQRMERKERDAKRPRGGGARPIGKILGGDK